MKRKISIVMILVIIISTLSMSETICFAKSSNEGYVSKENTNKEFLKGSITKDNPIYDDEGKSNISKNPLKSGSITTKNYNKKGNKEITSIASVINILRDSLVNRVESTKLTFVFNDADFDCEINTEVLSAFFNVVYEKIFEHTMKPNEGDYLFNHYSKCTMFYDYNDSLSTDDTTAFDLDFQFVLKTNLSEEEAVTKKVNEIIASFNFDKLTSDYVKVKTIYDYLCKNVAYDTTNNNDYDKKYTAYAALIDNLAVCQGYANAFYRLALEVGLDCRIIRGLAGTSYATMNGHAWNIVKVGQKYYNVDSTWGSDNDYDYIHSFLASDKKGTQFTNEHIRDNGISAYGMDASGNILYNTESTKFDEREYTKLLDYSSDDFYSKYPMSNVAYSTCEQAHKSHNFEHIVIKKASCIEYGFEYDSCKNGDCITNLVDTTKDVHDYTKEVVAPTCDDKGYTIYTCKDCKKTYIGDYTNSLGHDFEKIKVVAPTCDSKGYTLYTCKRCGESYKGDFVAALEHDYDKQVVKPTCDDKGYTIYTCKNCKKTYIGDYTNSLGHDFEKIKVVAPTCDSKGYTLYTCKRCGENYKGDFVAALGHSNKVTSTKKATLSANGKINYKCDRCGAVTSKVVYRPKNFYLSSLQYVYDGKVKTPKVTVKDVNGDVIAASNYTVKMDDGRKNVGEYKVKITFKGNYSGSKSVYFTIFPKATSISKVTSKSKGLVVRWKKGSGQVTGYILSLSNNSSFSSGVKNYFVKNVKTTSKTISNLSKKKKYFIRVFAYKTLRNINYWSYASKIMSATTK